MPPSLLLRYDLLPLVVLSRRDRGCCCCCCVWWGRFRPLCLFFPWSRGAPVASLSQPSRSPSSTAPQRTAAHARQHATVTSAHLRLPTPLSSPLSRRERGHQQTAFPQRSVAPRPSPQPQRTFVSLLLPPHPRHLPAHIHTPPSTLHPPIASRRITPIASLLSVLVFVRLAGCLSVCLRVGGRCAGAGVAFPSPRCGRGAAAIRFFWLCSSWPQCCPSYPRGDS